MALGFCLESSIALEWTFVGHVQPFARKKGEIHAEQKPNPAGETPSIVTKVPILLLSFHLRAIQSVRLMSIVAGSLGVGSY